MLQREMPTGTVTFLFTDIEGSTRLWENHPELMRTSLATHDDLMRVAIVSENGHIFKTIGDAFCASFATAQEALNAVIKAQLSLAAQSWPPETPIKVRMALHTGAVESRENDYFGPPVNRVARLLSAGHGGQTLLSQTTFDLVRDSLAPGIGMKDLGSHQLKDLSRPEQIFQLSHPGLKDDFAPVRSLSNQPNNLPQQLTSFVGREQEVENLQTLLSKHRLITLAASGGSGKTRLALQVAANMLEHYPDGAWLVELASINDPNLVARTVADALGVTEQSGQPIQTTLASELKQKRMLLILDNCEHLLSSAGMVADHLLRNCSNLTILATSREALGISGEFTHRVPTLSLPDPRKVQTPESLNLYEAIRLFIDRAVQVQTGFAVTNENAPALASLCYRLDGIPLAIELAAARVRSLSVEEIDQRLDQRFRLLTGGSRTALPRQQTLRSLMDWSYDLLTPTEKLLLQRLSVYSGGWTLESAESVCVGDEVEEWELLDLMTSLCDKSLVVVAQKSGVTRYHLLQTVREYSHDRLVESRRDSELRDLHLTYFVNLGEEADPQLRGPDQRVWLERLESEHDNIRAALSWGLADPSRTLDALRLTGALWRFWLLRGHMTEGREWLTQALERDHDGDTAIRARALTGAGNLAEIQCEFDLAFACQSESLRISELLGDRWCVGMSKVLQGNVYGSQGKFELAHGYWQESLEIWRELDSEGKLSDRRGLAATLDNLGHIAQSSGDFELAHLRYTECLEIRIQLGNQSGIGFSYVNLGYNSLLKGDKSTGRDCYLKSLEIFIELADPFAISCALFGLGFSATPPNACRLWGAAERLRDELDTPLPPGESELYVVQLAECRNSLGDAAFDKLWAEGRAMSTGQAIQLALELE
jgi:predicted ATPase/class 3 adenylate cyclase